ncbi:peptidoglycan DD-metalloendopeptidase family protein [Neobacillus sp. YIM B06451]|uniref:peptidoglycan DD-metalloendopeptidase family protein n=1 Tax=Neobacillus sp. YIM B06451 TaxID=3070994 RepID=UPI00292EE261|nr:peptidoglycan DD-metalloendopeptidase family protein [Neobacillus sp. YIM B06451]
MKEYIFRFLLAGIMAVCISLLFLGSKQANAEEPGAVAKEKAEWTWPAEGIISDTFGTRGGRHKGIDIAGSRGSAVFAALDGKVIKSYLSSTYGNAILIEHPNGYVTVYAHLDKRLAEEGEQVRKGQKIGTMGTTGFSTGVHLHFEIHRSEWTFKKENAINPVRKLGRFEEGDFIAGGFNSGVSAEVIQSSETRVAALEDNGKSIHIVKKGDTLWDIAMASGIEVNELMELNSLETITIFPGQELKLEKWQPEPFPKGSAVLN